MKLLFFLLTAAFLQVSATGEAQTVTLSGKGVSLREAFDSISMQTGMGVFVDEDIFKESRPMDLNLRGVSVEQAMTICLKAQKIPLEFFIAGRGIVVKRKILARSVTDIRSTLTDPVELSGSVVDENGQPLGGATVRYVDGKVVAITDNTGKFVIKSPDDGRSLEVTYTGYSAFIFKSSAGKTIRISLQRSTSKLDEVQVITYGTTTYRLTTSDISTVTGREISEQPVNNPLLALEGRVPGLFVTQGNGLPGSNVTVRIQGQNSLSNGNNPFYVIDGVPYSSTLLPGVGSPLGHEPAVAANGSPLSFINPADIESITVLKDADATSIYGSQAANGAIIITTKKGKSGKTKLSVNASGGVANVTRKLSMMNTSQYLAMRHEALNNDGVTPSLGNGDYDLFLWDTTRYTDWQKTLIGRTAHYDDLQGNVSGGNVTTQFLIGSGFHRETSVFPGDVANTKGSVHFNINSVSSNQRFKIQLTGNYLVDKNKLPNTDLTNAAITLAPDASPLHNPDGSLNWEAGPTGFSTWLNGTNPLAYLNNTYNATTHNLISNTTISYSILPDLIVKVDGGYTYQQVNESNQVPATANDPAYLPIFGNSVRSATYADNNMTSWIVEPQLTYVWKAGAGTLSALAGATIRQLISNGQVLSGSSYSSDLQLGSILAAATVSVSSAINNVYHYGAGFGRLNYNWDDKYLLNLTMRRDGSSRFGPANQWHNFGAGGAGWVFSRESFVKEAFPALSFGKIRFSYGATGSDQIPDYQFMDLYTPPYGVTAPYQGTTGLMITNLYNPGLSWEETKKVEVGLDIGLWKDRVLLQAILYSNRSANELVGATLPYVAGFPIVSENLPDIVTNKGWEFVVHTKNVVSKNFSWSSSFNLTIERNRLSSVSKADDNTYYQQELGHSINSVILYHFLGVNDSTGVYQFATKGAPTPNPASTDQTVVLDLNPAYYGGFQNSFRYKEFQLDMLLQFVSQKGPNYRFAFYPGGAGYNQPTAVLKRWQKPGDVTDIQRFNSDYSISQQANYAQMSDGGYTDASFVRLKNVALSWQLPERLLPKTHLQSLRLYVLAQNLLTYTHYIGLDPENKSTQSLPPLRVLTAGVEVAL